MLRFVQDGIFGLFLAVLSAYGGAQADATSHGPVHVSSHSVVITIASRCRSCTMCPHSASSGTRLCLQGILVKHTRAVRCALCATCGQQCVWVLSLFLPWPPARLQPPGPHEVATLPEWRRLAAGAAAWECGAVQRGTAAWGYCRDGRCADGVGVMCGHVTVTVIQLYHGPWEPRAYSNPCPGTANWNQNLTRN